MVRPVPVQKSWQYKIRFGRVNTGRSEKTRRSIQMIPVFPSQAYDNSRLLYIEKRKKAGGISG
jgi:hypothetical protein